MKPHFPRCPRPRGQALLEMTVMLVGIVAILLGVVYVGGLTVANNRLLLSAKFNAEKAARQPDSVGAGADAQVQPGSRIPPYSRATASFAAGVIRRSKSPPGKRSRFRSWRTTGSPPRRM